MFSAVLLVSQRVLDAIEVRFTTTGNAGAAAEYRDEGGGLAMFGTLEIGHERSEANESGGEIAAFILPDVNDAYDSHN